MKILVIPNEVIKCKIYVSSYLIFDYSVKDLPEELISNFYSVFEYNDFFDMYSCRSSSLTVPSNYEVFLSNGQRFIGLKGSEEELLYFNLKYFHDKNEIIEVD